MTTEFYLHLLLAIAVLFFVFKVFGLVERLLITKKNIWYKSLIIKGNEVLGSDNIALVLGTIVTYTKWIVLFFLLYLAIPLVFSEIPETREWSLGILNVVKSTFVDIGISWINYIPNAITILVIIFVVRKIIQGTHFIFKKIENEEIIIEGFHGEWAPTTFSLIKYLIVAFTFIAIYPYLPGSGSKAFEGVSVFLGLLISLGSSSAIANIVAGVVLTYMRPFKVGDYVKIDGNKGLVVEKGITVTKICTYKNETITIPNTKILGSDILNYTVKAKNKELIVYTTVTIGYDTPWTLVHEMLKKAAKNTKLINQHREPFVLQNALNDYHVSYEINAYTEHEEILPQVYSELHQNIQTEFSKNGVEIMSPMFNVIRNKPENTVPNLS